MSMNDRINRNAAALRELQSITEAARLRIHAADSVLGLTVSKKVSIDDSLLDETRIEFSKSPPKRTTLKSSKSASDIRCTPYPQPEKAHVARTAPAALRKEPQQPRQQEKPKPVKSLSKSSKSVSDLRSQQKQTSSSKMPSLPVIKERNEQPKLKKSSHSASEVRSAPYPQKSKNSSCRTVLKKLQQVVRREPSASKVKSNKEKALKSSNSTCDARKQDPPLAVVTDDPKHLSKCSKTTSDLNAAVSARKFENDDPEDVKCLKAKIAINHAQIQNLRNRLHTAESPDAPQVVKVEPMVFSDEIQKTQGRRLIRLLKTEISRQQNQIRTLRGRLFSRFNQMEKSSSTEMKRPHANGSVSARMQRTTSASTVLKHL